MDKGSFDNFISLIDNDNEDEQFVRNSTLIYASTENFFNASEIIDETNYIPKTFESSVFDRNIGKLCFLNNLTNSNIISEEPKNKIFLVSKIHSYSCRHMKNIGKNYRKNKIRNVLKQDFQEYFIKKNKQRNNVINKTSNWDLKGMNFRPKKRNFRLFDKDVISKKVICHFFKFVNQLILYIDKNYHVKIHNLDYILKKKHYTIKCFTEILRMKFQKNIVCNLKNKKLEKLFSINMRRFYQTYFLKSHYFEETVKSLEIKFGEVYKNWFIKTSLELVNFPKIFNTQNGNEELNH